VGKAKIEGWWMKDTRWKALPTRMVTLATHGPTTTFSQPLIHVKITLNETRLGVDEMRLVYNTTLTVDVASHDDELRKAFMELVTQSGRTIYGPAAMLAKSRPTIKITETSRDGLRDIDLFDEEEVTQ
jgi:hypothetical protein